MTINVKLPTRVGVALICGLCQLCALSEPVSAGQAPSGSRVFEEHCASCHAKTDDPRIPTVASLRQRAPESIVDALTTGLMRDQGSSLSVAERRAVAEFITARTIGASTPARPAGMCTSPPNPSYDSTGGPHWVGWSPGGDKNDRFQSANQAGLTAADVPKLKLKWAFGFPNATAARSMPTFSSGRLLVGSQSGLVYALDAKSGCIIWTFQASAGVRSAITTGGVRGTRNGPTVAPAYFGDARSNVYAIDIITGRQLWVRKVDDHPSSHVTGAPVQYGGDIYVSVASGEEGQGGNAKYECCTFRGSVVKLNAITGNVAWKTYTIPQEPRPIGKNKSGTTRWGPAGAGVWSAPTIDAKRRLVYVATGNNYTEPPVATSDAVLALSLDTGQVVWSAQMTPNDVFVVGCGANPGPNCPETNGPDFDFGSSPMLVTVDQYRDRQLIVIGQKSGIGWAIDPDKKGEVVWQYRAGKGSALGGMEFGSAADAEHAYFGVADGIQNTAGELHAVNLQTGERAWVAPPRPVLCGERGRGCSPALLAALTVIPGAVFAGSQDGGLRAYSTSDGSLLWEFNTNRDFETVNGVAAKGASISGPGPIVVGGMVFMNSGYGALGGRPGNVLLAFGVEP